MASPFCCPLVAGQYLVVLPSRGLQPVRTPVQYEQSSGGQPSAAAAPPVSADAGFVEASQAKGSQVACGQDLSTEAGRKRLGGVVAALFICAFAFVTLSQDVGGQGGWTEVSGQFMTADPGVDHGVGVDHGAGADWRQAPHPKQAALAPSRGACVVPTRAAPVCASPESDSSRRPDTRRRAGRSVPKTGGLRSTAWS